MVSRYARKEMLDIWSEQSKYEAWLKVQKALVLAWHKLGLINKEENDKIQKNASFNIERINEIEADTKHDLIAFTTSVGESLGEEKRWIHYGITSSDCIDTALALQIKSALRLIIQDVETLIDTLKTRAYEHKATLMVGRSHGIHGEPITFGLVLANFANMLKLNLKNLKEVLDCASVGQLSGAMGNIAHTPFELEGMVCKTLGLKPAPISSQVISRDIHARVISELALLASTCENIALEVRHLQRSEVYEAEEYFSPKQKGSSAMPHKRNPVLSENITGLCRMIRSYVIPSLENVSLWHQRDISHSSVERFVFPDSFITADFMLARLTGLIKNLVIYPDNMLKNLELTGGLVFSQRVLLELPKKGLSREDSYKIVQKNAMKVWERLQSGENVRGLFLKLLLEDETLRQHLSEAEIKECFEYNYYLKNVDLILKRVFG
ncbi:adenylosuccinate lyase [Helicobacter sp. 13S00401-1]|uniref:adenylosuccinate lyase n=1 Tax=Helicobacter sp. 13S00401-1 TaxID=1905758 RepID=UPI000BA59330|nr:adenylosuccinate lyase [Helicobacter sp. 13S00401-1]PAF50354.1 adenylosuccinate lyase [Helicobacter sp. 13S00401-1]